MGNSWKGISDAKLKETEKKMLSYSGIPLDEFSVKDVVIDEDGSYVRTMVTGDSSKPKFVLVHGYGGSGIMFYKIMKQLA